ncbi:MAG TPA: hypothetical protein VFC19_15555 [Candidatus Limnocylindrales bacterium]|nr:hypothetical protein [Candidatus Limnocylindrales bacterium]
MPDDNLLMPTITETPQPVYRPWRVDSLVYPAFFGGPIAVTYLGTVNARRLGLSNRKLSLIVATGAAALTAQVLVIVFFLQDVSNGAQRLSFSAAGIVVWGVAQYLQRRPFRIFLLRGGEPASLWGAGVSTVIASLLLQFLLIYVVSSAVNR